MSDHKIRSENLRFLRLSQFVVRQYAHLYHGISVTGQEHLPPTGPVIVASNHQSHLDPPFLCAFSPRPIYFLAKEELFRTPVVRHLMTWMAMVPTPREGGAAGAMRAGIRILKEEHVLGVFPEGTRSRTGERLPAQAGIVALAVLGGNVPIVPAFISGSLEAMPPGSGFPRFRRTVRIRFGEAIRLTPQETNLKDKEAMQATAERVMDRIFALGPGGPTPKLLATELR